MRSRDNDEERCRTKVRNDGWSEIYSDPNKKADK